MGSGQWDLQASGIPPSPADLTLRQVAKQMVEPVATQAGPTLPVLLRLRLPNKSPPTAGNSVPQLGVHSILSPNRTLMGPSRHDLQLQLYGHILP